MFQYAFGKALEFSAGHNVVFESGHLREGRPPRKLDLTYLNVSYRECGASQLRAIGRAGESPQNFTLHNWVRRVLTTVHEPSWGYHPDLVRRLQRRKVGKAPTYLIGYWQSFKYFESLRLALLSDFRPRNEIPSATRELLARISGSRNLCLNVRRGDFAKIKETRNFHGLLSAKYYLRAVETLRESDSFNRVFIFSDDIEWCRSNLGHIPESTIVGHEHAGEGFSTYLELMKACSVFVLPNSTFGWWAGWLSVQEQKRITVPEHFFANRRLDYNNLYPESWERLPNL